MPKIYISNINFVTNKQGQKVCKVEGVRTKKVNDEFKKEYCSYWLNDYPITWHTDIIPINTKIEIKYSVDDKCYKLVD